MLSTLQNYRLSLQFSFLENELSSCYLSLSLTHTHTHMCMYVHAHSRFCSQHRILSNQSLCTPHLFFSFHLYLFAFLLPTFSLSSFLFFMEMISTLLRLKYVPIIHLFLPPKQLFPLITSALILTLSQKEKKYQIQISWMNQTWILLTLNFLPNPSLCHSPICSTLYSFYFHISQSHLNPSFFCSHIRPGINPCEGYQKNLSNFFNRNFSTIIYLFIFSQQQHLTNSKVHPPLSFSYPNFQDFNFYVVRFFLIDTYLFSAFILLFLRLIQYQVLISNNIYLILTNLNLRSYIFLKATGLCML